MLKNNSENALNFEEHLVTENWVETILFEFYSNEKSNPKVTVKSFEVAKGSESSESVLSDIKAISIEAEVDDEKKSHNFVVKLLPLDPFSRYFVTEAEFDLREIKFYTQVVPELEEFQKLRLKKNVPPIKLPTPTCHLAKYVPFDFSDTPPSTPNKINESIIVLEDLKKNGFQNVGFKKGLSLKQAESAFEAISRLHSLSLAMKVHEGVSLTEKYDFLFQTKKASMSYQQLMERGLPQLTDFLNKRSDMTEIVQGLNVIRPKTKYLIEVLLSPSEPISLITHTDFWSNNLLFKEDQCVILDWQMVTYSRPTNDLALLIISSLPAATRRQHKSHLLDFYWSHLIENAKKLDLDIENQLKYTREDLNVDYRSSQLLALLLCIGSIDVALKDPEIEERLICVLLDLHKEGVLSSDFVNRL